MLKYTMRTIRLVDYNEIDRLINESYQKKPRLYNVVADQEWNNDEEHTISVEKGTLDKWETETVEKFIATGKYSFALNALLKDLCNKGLIEPGDYTIDISW